MFQGWSRSNNPQAKMLRTQTLPQYAGLYRGGPYTSLANRGNNMEKSDLNKSMCEKLFGGKLEVTVVPDMFLPIREGIAEVLHELKQLRKNTEHTEGWAESFGNQLGKALGREVELARVQSVKSVRDEGCQKRC